VRVAEKTVADGRWLFQWRSLVPVALLPIAIVALPDAAATAERIGDAGCRAVQWIALSIALLGLAVRCATVAFAPDGTSSRDTRALRAPSLNTSGLYSIVRHPLYLGAGMMWVGIAMSLGVWWVVVTVSMAFWLYVERLMIAEETFLEATFADEFAFWVSHTNAVVPRLSNWRPPLGTFQLKRLSSEHNGLLTVGIAFPVLQYLVNLAGERRSWHDWSARHSSLMLLFAITVTTSALCIVLRRLPTPSIAPPESSAHRID
jgi:protein-S-isoprenylcysteine O-methyltransferase Ste14